MIKVTLGGFSEGAAELRRMRAKYPKAVEAATLAMAQEALDKLRDDAWAGAFGPPKRRPNGKPTLIDSEKYLNGYFVMRIGRGAAVDVQGQNDNMSNKALQGVLEYGRGDIAARPHLRIIQAWVNRVYVEKIGKRVVDGLLGGRA